jgi:hypothetical protein
MQKPAKPEEKEALQPAGTPEAVGHVSVKRSRLERIMRSHVMRRFLISFGILIATALLLGLFGGFVLNGIISRRVVESVNSRPGQHLTIGNVRINILTGSMTVSDIALQIHPPAAAPGVDSLRITVPDMSVDGVERLSLLLDDGLHAEGVTIDSLRIGIYRGEQVDTVVLQQPDTTDNYLETGLLGSLAESLPERISPMTIDHVELTDAALFRSRRFDGQTVLDSITSFDLSVNDLNSKPLTNSPDKPGYYSRMELKGRGIVLQLARGVYTASLASLEASSEDSLMTIRSFRINPNLPEDRFFDTATGRLSRFTVMIPAASVHGIQFHRIWYSEITMREMDVDAPVITVLSDRRYPRSSELPRPRMPVEFIDAIKPLLIIDSLHVRGGKVTYNELHPRSSGPGVVRFDDITLDAAGIDTRTPATDRGTAIIASGRLFDSARLHLIMDLPLASNATIYYEGWLEPIGATRLNEFLVPAEQAEVTSGRINRVTFTVRIQGGRATGTVTPTYSDLSARLLEIPGTDETGFTGWMKRSAGQNFSVIPANPLPGDTVRVGQIDYGRELDQAFFGFIWNALWDGMRKVVGV